ncbi:MAG: NAD(P)/FAD-dependent oxidoreductase [Candidatus Lernaella stagnicola]|nr:NAD(P)/FAD-dependent oxidoreductase [Candidatus Lernaella stagnicola]
MSVQAKTWDVIVVGGGPAGAVVARRLAERGIAVALFDHSHPRFKPCSGFLSHDVAPFEPVVAEFTDREEFVGDRRYTAPNGKSFVVPGKLAATQFDLVDRAQFDWFLLQRAIAAGARWVKQRVKSLRRDGKQWIVTSEEGEQRADFLIGADGAGSVVRRELLGKFNPRDLIAGAGRRYPDVRPAELDTIFLPEGGIVFRLPGRDFAQLVLARRADRAVGLTKRLAAFAAKYATEWPSDFVPWFGLQPSPSSPGFFDRPASGPGFCLIGDAAGHTDAANGEGIIYAIRGAVAAADAIVEGRPEDYESRWRDQFGERLIKGARQADIAASTRRLNIAATLLARSPHLVAAVSRGLAADRSMAGLIRAALPHGHRIAWEIVRGPRPPARRN